MAEGTATTRRPIRRRRIIERPRLTRLLDESQGRIKLLVAPAGYGKTTLARQWLTDRNAAWYGGSVSSGDVAALAAGVAGAAAALVPNAGNALIERLSVTSRADEEPDVLAGILAADLSGWPQSAWFVFDDYGAIVGVTPAERFLETLLVMAPLNVLVLSRRRPRWATARRILYGEVFQLDQDILAMTESEATELLGSAGPDITALHDLAQGWPAVLALAHAAGTTLPELSRTSHLHDFLAAELYNRLGSDDRYHLCLLALFDSASRRVGLARLCIADSAGLIRRGVETGFLSESHAGDLDMHPLLRSFLIGRFREDWVDQVSEVVGRVARVLVEEGFWDEAFSVIERFDQHWLLPELVASSMQALLATGRSATLRRWIDASPETAVTMLAAAELAFREGHFHESEAIAVLAARDSADDELATRSLLVAGRAAHAASRPDEARHHYTEARERAVSDEVARLALLGELGAAIELERDDAIDLLDSLGPSDELDPDERAILVSRRINLETRFALPISLDEARPVIQILGRVGDPMLRASFRNVVGYTLAAMGHTEEALRLTEELLEEADRYRLEFVIPYALATQALVQTCRHEYQGAAESLDEAEERALVSGDRTAYHIAWGVRIRLTNAQAAFEKSLGRALPLESDQTRSLEAELLASYAVALAGVGDVDRARAYALRAHAMSRAAETAISAPAAMAIADLRLGRADSALTQAKQALAVATRSGMIEAFVSAYRGCPELLACLLSDPSCHDHLTRVLLTAGDDSALTNAGGPRSVLQLSPREKEVLALVAQGMTNPQIGKALFISPVTVKVHVRHIFEKLGVSSRAEAAVRIGQLGRD